MTNPTVDQLQKLLASEVFHYTTHSKKAAGRALGTLVEVITFYMLHSWGFRNSIAIERSLSEYANPQISHNVEYSLHPILGTDRRQFSLARKPLTAAKIRSAFWGVDREKGEDKDTNNFLLSTSGILRNACTVAETRSGPYIAHLEEFELEKLACDVSLSQLHSHPYAIFECKRVGVEDKTKKAEGDAIQEDTILEDTEAQTEKARGKGPQTIEKAKQGAYVARAVSSLQKVRLRDGSVAGFVQTPNGDVLCQPYSAMLREVIDADNSEMLSGFVLTVGVVSNHGNWFTEDNPNKEIKVLAQSYDWLLFLTDAGLADFIQELITAPTEHLEPVRAAFEESYTGVAGKNRFTKVQMDAKADKILRVYFQEHQERIASWFNVISPRQSSFAMLRGDLTKLGQKDWKGVFGL